MTTWILIWVVFVYQGIATGSQEFSSEQACQAAGEKLKDAQTSIKYVCVKK